MTSPVAPDPGAVIPETVRRLEEVIAAGRAPGVQLHVSRAGRPVADVALGESRTGVAMQPDTLVCWISMSKPVMGVAYAQTVERGLVGLDAKVTEFLPAFGAGGKEDIQLRHLLTHTAGFLSAHPTWYPCPPFWEVVKTICETPQDAGWVVGQTSGYNVAAAWYVLAAVLERVDGRSYRDYTRQEIFEPLGMDDCWIGIPPDRFRAYGDRIGVLPYKTSDGWRTGEAWGTEGGCAVLRPGGNGYGPVRQLARLYEMLLADGERDGVRILAPGSVAAIRQRRSEGRVDRLFGSVYDRGLGVVLDSKRHADGFSWYGTHASDETFGHSGYYSSTAFCDPAAALVVALVFHGVDESPAHDRRMVETLDAIYGDLGLATR